MDPAVGLPAVVRVTVTMGFVERSAKKGGSTNSGLCLSAIPEKKKDNCNWGWGWEDRGEGGVVRLGWIWD